MLWLKLATCFVAEARGLLTPCTVCCIYSCNVATAHHVAATSCAATHLVSLIMIMSPAFLAAKLCNARPQLHLVFACKFPSSRSALHLYIDLVCQTMQTTEHLNWKQGYFVLLWAEEASLVTFCQGSFDLCETAGAKSACCTCGVSIHIDVLTSHQQQTLHCLLQLKYKCECTL